ncbi:glycosyltransferase [Candidatus Sumerlaeota bacterium]|nr:glycosyltransferase [Candidatus Sumerlaeota bacterium]
MAHTISVVILTQNRAALLRDCLEALQAQSRPPDEVVIVDNGSTDSTPEVLAPYASGERGRSAPFSLKVVQGTTEKGLATARNLGAREASGDWVAFTDDDCRPREDWLGWIAEHAEREDVDAVGGLVEPANRLRYPWWWHPEIRWAIGLSVPDLYGPLAGSIYYPQTANWATRRSVLLAEPFRHIPANLSAGKRLLRAEREDSDLWRRLRRNGYRTRFDPNMVVYHWTDASRLRFFDLLRRARRDGVALQRHEPHRELLRCAADTLVSLPIDLAFGIWTWKHAPWREAAWRLVWAARQGGQWAEALDRDGKIRGGALFAWMASAILARKTLGALKRATRRSMILAYRAVQRLRGRTKRPRSPARPPRSIVVAACGYLGDIVLLHPCLTALKSDRPEVEITLLTNRHGEEIYRHEPTLRQIVLLGGPEGHRAGDSAAIRHALQATKAELILVPYFYEVSPGALFSSRARVVAFREEVGFGRRWWYDRADKLVAKPYGRPEIENLRHLFAEAGLKSRLENVPPLAFLPDEWTESDNAMRAAGVSRENLVLVAPGSGKENKLWVEDRWAEVVRYLTDEYDLHVALIGSPAEEPMCRRIVEASRREAMVWCDPSVRRLALQIARARLVVGCDSGCKHLAVAMETPSLTLFGPTDERQWGAMRHPGKHGVVRGCAFDLTHEERIGLAPNHQMLCIQTQYVLSALDEMLSER